MDQIPEYEDEEEGFISIQVSDASSAKAIPEKVTIEEDIVYSGGKLWPRSLLVVVAIRLGLYKIDAEYFDAIKACFELP